MVVPLKPASHQQPDPTLVPVESDGQLVALQLPEKNRAVDVAVIVPLKPASHLQPDPTLVPVESDGQLVALQLPEKKGLVDVAVIVPLKPTSHLQSPAGTLVVMQLLERGDVDVAVTIEETPLFV